MTDYYAAYAYYKALGLADHDAHAKAEENLLQQEEVSDDLRHLRPQKH